MVCPSGCIRTARSIRLWFRCNLSLESTQIRDTQYHTARLHLLLMKCALRIEDQYLDMLAWYQLALLRISWLDSRSVTLYSSSPLQLILGTTWILTFLVLGQVWTETLYSFGCWAGSTGISIGVSTDSASSYWGPWCLEKFVDNLYVLDFNCLLFFIPNWEASAEWTSKQSSVKW